MDILSFHDETPPRSIFTRDAWTCLEERVMDPANKHTWGYDLMYHRVCKDHGAGNIGLVDTMCMTKPFATSYDHGAAGEEMTAYMANKHGRKREDYPQPETLGELRN